MADGNNIVPFDKWAPVPAVFKGDVIDTSHYTAGIGMSWPTLTIKGKTWGTRFRGENKQVLAPNDQAGGALMPVQFLDLIIVETAERISKVYYKGGYVDNDHTPPDCWSADGITPDEGASDKQAKTCRGCRHNVMNSRVAEGTSGTIVKGKACSDNKRLAVVSVHDIPNKMFDGCPLMLRLSPTSFTNYTAFVNQILGKGYPLYSVVVRLTFDHTVAHPKIVFTPLRVVTNEEAAQVVELRKNPIINDMLNDKTVAAFSDPNAEEGGVEPLLSADPANDQQGEPEPEPERKVTSYIAEPIKIRLPAGVTPELWATFPEPVKVAMLAAMPKAEPEKPKIKLPPGMTQEMFDGLPGSVQAAMWAAQEKAPEPPTPEQMKAKADAGEAPRKPGRPRSKPVAPPPLTTAAVTPQGNGANEPTPDKALSNSLSDRISKAAGEA